jgi:hypothetical protein
MNPDELVLDIELNQENMMKNEQYYKMLVKRLESKKIPHIAMQYPLLGIDDLKTMLKSNYSAYVSNRENFVLALERHTYDDLFIDSFGGDFGHATVLGNQIIAENLARAILNLTEKK